MCEYLYLISVRKWRLTCIPLNLLEIELYQLIILITQVVNDSKSAGFSIL